MIIPRNYTGAAATVGKYLLLSISNTIRVLHFNMSISLYIIYLLVIIIIFLWLKVYLTMMSMSLWQVCRCISELCRHRSFHENGMLLECKNRGDIPSPEVDLSFLKCIWFLFLILYMTKYMFLGTFCAVDCTFAWSSSKRAACHTDFDGKHPLFYPKVMFGLQ